MTMAKSILGDDPFGGEAAGGDGEAPAQKKTARKEPAAPKKKSR